MTRSKWLSAAAGISLCTLAAGCGATANSEAPSPAAVRAAFAGSPAPLAALHAQANALITTTPAAFSARLAELRGYPVVINKWASWCGPCRQEFPSFQRAAVTFGRQVAFLGLDSFDNSDNARTFLRQYPVSYPSFEDGNDKVANALHAGAFFPTTVFLDRSGKLAYLHQGPYTTAAALETDVRRYALHGA
jgi:cytochrome c biogenesis protein CcmG, thiol:disulfide interchange protein DsbE